MHELCLTISREQLHEVHDVHSYRNGQILDVAKVNITYVRTGGDQMIQVGVRPTLGLGNGYKQEM